MGKTRDLFKKIRDFLRGTLEGDKIREDISCKDGLDKRQKWYGPNRNRRYQEEVARIHKIVQIQSSRPR